MPRLAQLSRPALLLSLACTQQVEQPAKVPVWAGPLVTDADAYVARPLPGPAAEYGFPVVARFTNRLPRPVRLEWCGLGPQQPSFYLLKAARDSTVPAYHQAYEACVGNEGLLVAAGATRVDTLLIAGQSGEQWDAGMVRVWAGQFRIGYRVIGGEPAWPMDSSRWSNPFTVTRAR